MITKNRQLKGAGHRYPLILTSNFTEANLYIFSPQWTDRLSVLMNQQRFPKRLPQFLGK